MLMNDPQAKPLAVMGRRASIGGMKPSEPLRAFAGLVRIGCLATLAALGMSAPAEAACRLALALGLDVSGSVDAREYRLQMDGLASALTDRDVRDALLASPGAPVALAVYEWSGSEYQRLIQDWAVISDDGALLVVVARLRGWTRGPAPEATGLAAAMEYGHGLIGRGPECWDRTLDISGDGKNNDWPTPRNLRLRGRLDGLRINGLAIIRPGLEDVDLARELASLPRYYEAEVVQGPDAFVEIAEGFEDYARAMRRKLLKELTTRPVGALEVGREKPGRF